MNKKLAAIIITLLFHSISLIGNLRAGVNSLQNLAFQKIINELRNTKVNLNEEIPYSLRDENYSYNKNLDSILLSQQSYLFDRLVKPLHTYFPILEEPICATHIAGIASPNNIDKSDMIHSLIQIKNGELKGYLVSASHENSIKVLNPHTGECIRTLEGHTGAITSVIELVYLDANISSKIRQNYIASASRDNTIRVWDILTGECIRIFEAEDAFVIIELKNGTIASAGKEIKIWDTSIGECIEILREHSDRISSLAQLNNDNFLASASFDGTIKIWDLSTGQYIRMLNHNYDRIQHWALSVIQLNNGNLASTSSDKTIKIWDPFTGECIRTLEGHDDSVTCVIQLRNGNLISGSTDGTIKIWDLSRNKEDECLATLDGHTSTIKTLVQLNDGNLVSGSYDRTIKLWHLYSPDMQKFSLKQYILLLHLNNYKNNYETISLHNEWLKIFQTLPESCQNKFRAIIQNQEDDDYQVGSKRKYLNGETHYLLTKNKNLKYEL